MTGAIEDVRRSRVFINGSSIPEESESGVVSFAALDGTNGAELTPFVVGRVRFLELDSLGLPDFLF